MTSEIDRSYERLVGAGKVGIGRTDLTQGTDGRFRLGPDCERGGCHRTGAEFARIKGETRWWNVYVCHPCAQAITDHQAQR